MCHRRLLFSVITMTWQTNLGFKMDVNVVILHSLIVQFMYSLSCSTGRVICCIQCNMSSFLYVHQFKCTNLIFYSTMLHSNSTLSMFICWISSISGGWCGCCCIFVGILAFTEREDGSLDSITVRKWLLVEKKLT